MFKKIKKDRNKTLLVLFLEVILALGLTATYMLLKINFVTNYGIYIIIGYFLLVILFNVWVIKKQFISSEKYLDRTDITITSIFGNEVTPAFEFGNIAILVYNEEDEIIWVSQTTIIKKEDTLGKKVRDLLPSFDDVVAEESEKEAYVKIGDKTYQTMINTGLKVIYLKDVTTQFIQNTKFEDERIFLGHIVIDNYQDVAVSIGESDFALYQFQIKEIVQDWAKKYNLFIRSYGNDSFLILGEEHNYQNIFEDKFSLLDEVRKNATSTENPLTVSVGIGRGNTSSSLRTSELAYEALNMALSRGGDQVVVNTFGKPFEYFGAKSEIKQNRSHIRGRVQSATLINLIKGAKDIIIMGHDFADFDAIGSSIGVWTICKQLGKKAYFIYEDSRVDEQARNAIRNTFTMDEINSMSVTPARALQVVNEQTLCIVVDTHRPKSTLQPRILDICKDICVIDHHRKGEDYINNPVFSYHESQASSASELITELIFYSPQKINVSEKVANFLLSGLCLDTKFFSKSTTGKTFEMAMVLKNNYQANVEVVNEFFKDEYEVSLLISEMIGSSKVLATGVYLATAKDDGNAISSSTLAKCADELLNKKGVEAVFVIGRVEPNKVALSGRSLSTFNVEIIVKALGGGGHFNSAGAQFMNKTVSEVAEMLIEKVKIYKRDGNL